MTIERRVQATSGVLILFALVMASTLFWTSRQVGEGIKDIETTSRLVHSAFMLKVLMDDYLDRGGTRPLQQWDLHYERLGRILNEQGIGQLPDSAALDDLQDRYVAVASLAPRVTKMAVVTGRRDEDQAREILTGQISIRLEQLVNAAIDLNARVQSLTLRKRTFVQGLIVATGLVMIAIILVNIYLIRRSVVNPLKELAIGAEKIGAGSFDYVRETKSNDEVGILTRAFNLMIQRVQERATALKKAHDELEQRVQERTAELEIAREVTVAERQRLYEVLETLPVYVCLLDSEHHMPFANRYFRETFGESLGRRCHEFLFNRTEPCEICETYTVMKTRAPHHWYWTGPNGRDYDIYDFPFIDTGGSFLILEMGIDITERKKAEEALNRTLAELTRSNTDLEQFAYVASHDLQEPLRNVASCVQMLEHKYKDKLDADADQLIRYAVESAARMKVLINDLLAYSRISTKGNPFQLTNSEEVLDQALANLRPAIEATSAVVSHEPLPLVWADFTQLSQVFQNLIGNGIKFYGQEPPRVHVSAVRAGNDWVFSVKDNGIGIEPRHLERIFVIFQRLNKRSEYEGTGMGLAIVKRIIERHQGKIWVESKPGEGTTVYFTIRAKESET